MKFNRIHFPNSILYLILFLSIFSCKKNVKTTVVPQKDNSYNEYLSLAEVQLKNSKFYSAYYYYNKSKSVCGSKNRNNKMIYSLLKMAIIQQNKSDYFNSETTATEAIALFQKDTEEQYKIGIYMLLGINYQGLYEYDTAIKYYKVAYNLTSDILTKAIIKNNIALVYLREEKYSTAANFLLPLLSIKEVLENTENHARILDNLGYCYQCRFLKQI